MIFFLNVTDVENIYYDSGIRKEAVRVRKVANIKEKNLGQWDFGDLLFFTEVEKTPTILKT